MKKSLFVLFSFLATMNAWSLNYCQSSAFGYGAAATGGTSAPTQVTSASALKSSLKSNAVVIITQDITLTKAIELKDVKNLTILALPGKKISNLEQNKDNSGIFYFKSGCSNIVIRNVTFIGPGAYDCNGHDLLSFEGVNKAWVDHCDFQDGVDGNFDNTKSTDIITVSWCRFRYLKNYKSGGEAKDHRFTNLVGSDASDKPSDGTYNITWAYCWWDDGCRERMTRCRNASQHFLNCYWNSSVANYYIGPENADCYIEGCYIEGKPAKDHIFYQNYGGTNGVNFVNCYSKNGVPSNITNRTVVTPSYNYTAVTYSEAKTMVTNSSCGAGATLTVTTAGAVSSSCDSGDDPTPTPVAPTLSFAQSSMSVQVGQTITQTATTNSDGAVTYSSDKSNIATVNSQTGQVSGIAEGTATITATVAATSSFTQKTATYTVTVTNSATPPTPPTPSSDLTWNVSDTKTFTAGDFKTTTTIDGLSLVAKDGKNMAIESVNKSYKQDGEEYTFTQVIKTKGQMNTDYRYIQFAVTGTCTIEIYCYSGSSSNTQNILMYKNSVSDGNKLTTLVADKAVCKVTYQYTGGACNILFGGESGGIHVYAIRITYSSSTDLQRAKESLMPNKIIRNGQLFIRHNGHYYNCVGQPVHR